MSVYFDTVKIGTMPMCRVCFPRMPKVGEVWWMASRRKGLACRLRRSKNWNFISPVTVDRITPTCIFLGRY